MALDILTPISESVLAKKLLFSSKSIGNQIDLHSLQSGLPSIENVDLAVIGVLEHRRDDNYLGGSFELDAIREQFYSLYPGNWDKKMVDLGNLQAGNTVEDTYFALKQIIEVLFERGIVVLLLGGSQDVAYAQYRSYDDHHKMINIVNVDAGFDLGDADDELSNKSYVGKIVVDKPYNLFNYSNVGYQTYFNAQEEINLIEKLYFDAYRLGEVSNHISSVEPVMRDANMVTVDVSSIAASALGSKTHTSPNGFDGKEICALSRYAGISDKVTSFGIYELQRNYASATAAMLIAQMMWYFIEGVNYRKNETNLNAKEKFTKYQVPIDEDVLIFYKSEKSGRWWVEIPFIPNVSNKLKRHTLLPCTQQDYLDACNQQIPERWYKARRKNEV
ncbi:formimidoylglutamase [Gangjinia marincola]|uniref:Formimidoylglutamase n=1 Tax=Gangjinia marincola TaxID=578463 RepID=A0ABN1MEB8_9FLAO